MNSRKINDRKVGRTRNKLGAPRVLQAVARDNVIPPLLPFARGSRHNDEPHRALFVTLVI